ncbi:GNAT domain-containing protein [Aspergillus karnatakaensis]|uniref:GNAT family N-acetyltransferase n=1 Tax=Aspergillus karnatakaensis TaxID=1810916 RepID=UPI003CCCE44E
MTDSTPEISNFEPFALLSSTLILLPTPIAIDIQAYRKMYSGVHANPDFCTMAFGPHFPARRWSDEETRQVIQTRDVERCWLKRGMGDFAVGVVDNPTEDFSKAGREIGSTGGKGVRLLEGEEFGRLFGKETGVLGRVAWVGYAGMRDATTTSMPDRTPEDLVLPPWEEMVEVRYGVAQEYWGKGVARKAADAVMQWAVSERGVRRFIAETERENVRSGRVLEKMGFVLSGTDYWKEPSEVEWERVVA